MSVNIDCTLITEEIDVCRFYQELVYTKACICLTTTNKQYITNILVTFYIRQNKKQKISVHTRKKNYNHNEKMKIKIQRAHSKIS